ncbi:UNKNOWN [Stylonychia lemnae]|uniref:Uncharacterized protein n=1 Tax=Stylonychia lemnae TaxID=5949 RepID=A0A078A6L0_STYLE|nr:UNKNOWN [Stylonychia lemnae]|eukprot:CDW77232.1 UNKNOWN [Stylonychia lemnae]
MRASHDQSMISNQSTISAKKPPRANLKIKQAVKKQEVKDKENSGATHNFEQKKLNTSYSCKAILKMNTNKNQIINDTEGDEQNEDITVDQSYNESPMSSTQKKHALNQMKLRTQMNTLRRYNNSTLSHNNVNRVIESDDDNSPTIYQPKHDDENTIISDNNPHMSSFDSQQSQMLGPDNSKRVTQEWERKFVNISMLLKEKSKRRKLSKLYSEQTNTNEMLRDENDNLQSQQRALIRLLQEKDNKLKQVGNFSSAPRQQSVERFIQRFSREIDDEEDISERNIVLRRLVLRKFKDMQDWFHRWRRESLILIAIDKIEEERQEIVKRLVSRSFNYIGQIAQRCRQRVVGASFRKIIDYKGKRTQGDYQKIMALNSMTFVLDKNVQRNKNHAWRQICQYKSKKHDEQQLQIQNQTFIQDQQLMQQKASFKLVKIYKKQLFKNKQNSFNLWKDDLQGLKQMRKLIINKKMKTIKQALLKWHKISIKYTAKLKQDEAQKSIKRISDISKRYISLNTLFNIKLRQVNQTKSRYFIIWNQSLTQNHLTDMLQQSRYEQQTISKTIPAAQILTTIMNKSSERLNKRLFLEKLMSIKLKSKEKQVKISSIIQSLSVIFQGKMKLKLNAYFQRFKTINMQRTFDLEKAKHFKNFQYQLFTFKQSFEELQQANDSLSQQNEQLTSMISKQLDEQYQEQIDKLKSDLKSKTNDYIESRREIDILKLNLQKQQNENYQLQEDIIEFKERFPLLQREKEVLDDKIKSLMNQRKEFEDFQLENMNLKSELQSKMQQMEQMQQYIKQLESSNQKTNSKQEQLMAVLKDEKSQLIGQLEQSANDILMLRKNYDIQVNQNVMKNEEMRMKDEYMHGMEEKMRNMEQQYINLQDQFRQKMNVVQQEFEKLMESRGKQVNQDEMNRMKQQYDQKVQKLIQDMQDKEQQLDKMRSQNAEITRELVEVTNESGSAKNEARILRDKLNKAKLDLQRLEEALNHKELQLNDIKSDQQSVISKTKNDQLRQIDQMRADIHRLQREKDSIEQQLKEQLVLYDNQLKYHSEEKTKLHTQINNYRDENENLKKQYFNLDKKLHSEQSKYEDDMDRLTGVYQQLQKKHSEAKQQIKQCEKDLGSYQIILEKLDATVKDLQHKSQNAQQERDRAVDENRQIRQRYSKIIGTEKFLQDFPN